MESFANLKFLTIQSLNLLDSSLKGLNQLKHLDLRNCGFENFNCQSFLHVPNLEVLRIERPQEMKWWNFDELKMLKWLEITVDFLDHVDSFSDNLRVLIVNIIENWTFCKFEEILKHSKLPNLKRLKINGLHQSQKFDMNLLSGLSSLKCFEINLAKIGSLDYFLLPSLETLEFYFCKFSSSKIEFSNFSNLKSLDLWFCSLPSLKLFSSLGKLENLSFFNSTFKVSNFQILDRKAFVCLENLKTLTLFSDQIFQIDPNPFLNTPNLETLFLISKKFDNLPADIFRDLRNLKVLEMYCLESGSLQSKPEIFLTFPKSLQQVFLPRDILKEMRSSFDSIYGSKIQFLSI